MLWHFRGTPHYLGQQAVRLGITPVLADRARNNQEIYRVSVLLAQLSERYHKARKRRRAARPAGRRTGPDPRHAPSGRTGMRQAARAGRRRRHDDRRGLASLRRLDPRAALRGLVRL